MGVSKSNFNDRTTNCVKTFKRSSAKNTVYTAGSSRAQLCLVRVHIFKKNGSVNLLDRPSSKKEFKKIFSDIVKKLQRKWQPISNV